MSGSSKKVSRLNSANQFKLMKWLETMKAPIESGELGYKTHDEITERARATMPFAVSTCNISGALSDLGIKTTKSAAKGAPSIERGLSNKRLTALVARLFNNTRPGMPMPADLMPFLRDTDDERGQGSLL